VPDADTLPLLFRVSEWVEFFAARNAPTAAHLGVALGRVGRNLGPALLTELCDDGLLTRESAIAHVGNVWSMAEFPDAYLDHEIWRELFQFVGFTRNGHQAQRPSAHLTLYRGAIPARRSDWSWTDRYDVAVAYACGRYGRPIGSVWEATVEPWRLLARNDDPDGRNEAEYVVDTDGLLLRKATVRG